MPNAAAIAFPPVVEPPAPQIEDLVEDLAAAAIRVIARSIVEFQNGGLDPATKMSAHLFAQLVVLWLEHPEIDVPTTVRQRLGSRSMPEFLIDGLLEIVTMVRADEIAYQRAQAN